MAINHAFTCLAILAVLACNINAQSDQSLGKCLIDSSKLILKQDFYTNGRIHAQGFTFNNEKYGDWQYYNSSGKIVRRVEYCNGIVKDIQLKYLDQGKVIERYDALNKTQLPSLINIRFEYPDIARDNEIQGVVKVKLEYDSLCILNSYRVLNHLGYGIDEEVKRGMDENVTLSQKYHVTREDCETAQDTLKINFTLN
jgi:hypothetical protein